MGDDGKREKACPLFFFLPNLPPTTQRGLYGGERPDTNSHKFVLTVARFWPQHWLAVRTMPQDLIGCWNQQKLKALIPFQAWLFSWMICRRWREGSILLSFFVLWSYGTKYVLICTMEIQKKQVVVSISSGFALFPQLMWVYRGVESLCKLLTANKVPFDLLTNECKSKYCPS